MKFYSPDPFDDVVVGVVELGLEHLEIPDLEAAGGERDLRNQMESMIKCGEPTETGAFRPHLEVHGDWGPGPLLLAVRLQQLYLSRDLRLLHSGHALDLPDDGVLRGLVLGLALHTDQLDAGSVQRRRDANLNLLG